MSSIEQQQQSTLRAFKKFPDLAKFLAKRFVDNVSKARLRYVYIESPAAVFSSCLSECAKCVDEKEGVVS